ncbi:MAG: metallophosphoesterase [Deltaproteobacteria bacterium]
MMDRRNFIKQFGLGLAASWAWGRLFWPWRAGATGPDLRLALLADAHLKDGDANLPEAQALARAVAEINACLPPPDLVLFAGDLAHQGRAEALDLGREILADLAAPLWAVRGEGDPGTGGDAAWIRRFDSPKFSRPYQGAHFLGLDTGLCRTPRGPAFEIGEAQLRWLARELTGLDPATPLVIVSHAPLAQLFLPWQQWTTDAFRLVPLLSRFRQVLCLHGHTHMAGVSKAVASGQGSRVSTGHDFSPENRRPQTGTTLHLSLPATAWPLPAALQGTPAVTRPGTGPRGCGWSLVTLNPAGADFQPRLWQA